MMRSRTLRRYAPLGILALAVVVVLLCRACREPEAGWQVAERKESVRRLYRLLSAYEMKHGAIPCSSRGPDFALYELEPVAKVTPWFDEAAGGPLVAVGPDVLDVQFTRLGNGDATWDDNAKCVRNADYDYLNKAIALDRTSPQVAIYAEKAGSTRGGRWVVFSNGAMLWISKANEHYGSPLGMSWSDLGKGEATPVAQPHGVLSRGQLSEREGQYMELLVILQRYAERNGALLHSTRGADYALFRLRGAVTGAGCLDARYTRLENGVAYWNDKEQRLENGDFEYLNEPIAFDRKSGELSRDVVLLADKWGVCSLNARWVAWPFRVGVVPRGSPNADWPLGRGIGELEVYDVRAAESWP